jgi:hypothetical protein
MSLHTPDLTKQPPRSARVRLGGYVILPRMLDKGRATIAGKTANTTTPARSTSIFDVRGH